VRVRCVRVCVSKCIHTQYCISIYNTYDRFTTGTEGRHGGLSTAGPLIPSVLGCILRTIVQLNIYRERGNAGKGVVLGEGTRAVDQEL